MQRNLEGESVSSPFHLNIWSRDIVSLWTENCTVCCCNNIRIL